MRMFSCVGGEKKRKRVIERRERRERRERERDRERESWRVRA
jgi:hypothetical protein